MSSELDRQIAEVLGWKLAKTQTRAGELIATYAPDGSKTFKILPRWSVDATAALALFKVPQYHVVELHIEWGTPQTYSVLIRCRGGDPDRVLETLEYDTPAEAVCQAFLLWQDMNVQS